MIITIEIEVLLVGIICGSMAFAVRELVIALKEIHKDDK